MEALSNLIPDDGPSNPIDLIVALFDSLQGHVVESHDVLQHPHGLVEGTVSVVRSVGVLLEEVILDQLGYFQSDLVGFCQGTLFMNE